MKIRDSQHEKGKIGLFDKDICDNYTEVYTFRNIQCIEKYVSQISKEIGRYKEKQIRKMVAKRKSGGLDNAKDKIIKKCHVCGRNHDVNYDCVTGVTIEAHEEKPRLPGSHSGG